jgi:hypothetical protein
MAATAERVTDEWRTGPSRTSECGEEKETTTRTDSNGSTRAVTTDDSREEHQSSFCGVGRCFAEERTKYLQDWFVESNRFYSAQWLREGRPIKEIHGGVRS